MNAGTPASDPNLHAVDADLPPTVSDGRAVGAERPIYFRDVAPAIEFACWVVLALAPFLRWVNGAAVTDDQFVIQVSLVCLAACGALGLRVYNWRTANRRVPEETPNPDSGRE
jgi:hypothetical protein